MYESFTLIERSAMKRYLRMGGAIAAALMLASCVTPRQDSDLMLELNGRLAAVASQEYGADRTPLAGLSSFLTAHRARAERRALESALAAFILDTGHSMAARQHVIRELGRVGSAQSASVLIGLLGDPDHGDDAAMALERMDDPRLRTPLMAAWADSPLPVKVRLAAIYGARRDESALPVLSETVRLGEPELIGPVIRALGSIATTAATDALMEAVPRVVGHDRADLWDAFLSCQASARASGERRVESRVRLVLDAAAPAHVRAASTMIHLYGVSSRETALRASGMLSSKTPADWAAGADLARYGTDDETIRVLIPIMPNLPPASQLAMLGIVEDRRMKDAESVVSGLTSSPEPQIRVAAIRALGAAGSARSVSLLIESAASGDEAMSVAARASLRVLDSPGVEEQLLETARSSKAPAARAEAIRASGERGVVSAISDMFGFLDDGETVVRAEAIRQIGALADSSEWGRLLDHLSAAERESDRQAWGVAAESVASRTPGAAVLVIEKLAATSTPARRIPLLDLAGRLSDAALLDIVGADVSHPDADVQRAAVRALGAWRSADALPSLTPAFDHPQEAVRRLAQRGAIQVVRRDTSLAPGQKAQKLAELAPRLGHADEKRALLSAAGDLPVPGSLKLALGYLDAPEVRAEAEAAVMAILKRRGAGDPSAREALGRLVAESANAAVQADARALLDAAPAGAKPPGQ